MDDTYYNEEATESCIALDFPSKSDLVFDFDDADSKEKGGSSGHRRGQLNEKNASLIQQFDKHIEDEENTQLRVKQKQKTPETRPSQGDKQARNPQSFEKKTTSPTEGPSGRQESTGPSEAKSSHSSF